MGTLVGRTTGFVRLIYLPTSWKVSQVRETLTAQFTELIGLEIYFCDPHAPRQRASNENISGPLR